MFLDLMGYMLSETFMLLVVISLTKGMLRLRRGPGQHRFLGPDDRELFFQPIKLTASKPMRFFRYALIFTAVATLGAIEIILLASCGAAIVTGALVVTCAAIVHFGLVEV